MEKLDIEYTEEDLGCLLDIFEVEHKGKKLKSSSSEATESLRLVLGESEMGSLYWAAFNVRMEDLARHLADDSISDETKKVLQWRLEIGK